MLQEGERGLDLIGLDRPGESRRSRRRDHGIKRFERTRACRPALQDISLWALAAFIAAHLRPELVEGHGAERWYSLAEHLEGHPHGPLAALASDPRITLGFKLGDGAVNAAS